MVQKLMMISVLIVAVLLLAGCKEDTQPVVCFDGYHEENGLCIKDDPVCYAPTDYSDTLTYSMVWNDEFDGSSLDTSKWRYEVYGGGGNNELQYYTDHNTTVSDGTLKIVSRHEEYNGWDYTSSRITTKDLGEWTYGIIEVRAKIPAGLGTWPAIWMMPSEARYGGWPKSGEMDIMEHVGFDPNRIYGTIHTDLYNHTKGSQKGGNTSDFTDVTSAFHVYKMEWLPDQIKFYVDDELYYTYDVHKYSSCPTYKVWPFNGDFYLILNNAVGGDWGGAKGVNPNDFPTTLEIDYVRVYQAAELQTFDDHTGS